MSAYRLTKTATRDLRTLLAYIAKRSGEAVALQVEDRLFEGFARLADFPGLGHRRSDLTASPCYFYSVEPYLIVYAREVNPLPIFAVLHASRDVRELLKKRRI